MQYKKLQKKSYQNQWRNVTAPIEAAASAHGGTAAVCRSAIKIISYNFSRPPPSSLPSRRLPDGHATLPQRRQKTFCRKKSPLIRMPFFSSAFAAIMENTSQAGSTSGRPRASLPRLMTNRSSAPTVGRQQERAGPDPPLEQREKPRRRLPGHHARRDGLQLSIDSLPGCTGKR